MERRSATGLGLVSARLRMEDNRQIRVTERTVATIGFEGIPHTPAPGGDQLLKEAL